VLEGAVALTCAGTKQFCCFIGPEGTVLVSAQVEVSPTFLSWVLCFGGQARILEPPSAREALQHLAREALARYEQESLRVEPSGEQ
jgi:predicted DNA-binding transcriptional regulator YafY